MFQKIEAPPRTFSTLALFALMLALALALSALAPTLEQVMGW